MPNRNLVRALSLSLTFLAACRLSGKSVWVVTSSGKIDPRIARRLHDLARQNQAEIRNLRSGRDAARQRARFLIELRKEKESSFSQALQQASSSSTSVPELTPALAREGFILESTRENSLIPSRIRITAATATGFHNALLRVSELLRLSPSDLAKELEPRPKSVRLKEDGKKVVISDFPSFPERGIVEGFYGVPWRHQDRLDILRFEGQHGMNVYYYAPKDDPYHRRLWRERYPPAEMNRLRELVGAARQNFVNFCFAISPGLSMLYSSSEDFRKLAAKLESVGRLGVSCFALFLDDVPQELESPADRKKFNTLAAAHVDLINRLERHLKSRSPANRLVVTPTTYTNEWGSRDYIRELGAGVSPDVDIVWTGPKVVSPALTVAAARDWGELLHRPPLVWDNFPVNDGIPWRLNLGPLVGRDPELPSAIRGLFSNPMNQARASLIPLETVASYLWNPAAYDAKRAHERALANQYNKDAAELLAPFLKTYGDYWWDENIFRPLFVEERRAIDTRAIEQRLAELNAALEVLRRQAHFEKLAAELAPSILRTTARLAEARSTPAFRQSPDQKLEWREDYEMLHAARLGVTPGIDGDFSKWQNGPLYILDKAEQIFGGARLWRGPSQFSSRFALGWDDDYLYVGVDLTDPALYQPFAGRGIDKGDAVVLMLETAFRKNFTSTEADGDEYHLFFSPGDFSGVAPSVYSDEDYLPLRPLPRDYGKEIKTGWKKTAAGFSGDIAIPVAWFEGGKFQEGYEIGLCLGAQKVLKPGKAGATEEVERITFESKSDKIFPARFGNPSSYQRLVLVGPEKRESGAANKE